LYEEGEDLVEELLPELHPEPVRVGAEAPLPGHRVEDADRAGPRLGVDVEEGAERLLRPRVAHVPPSLPLEDEEAEARPLPAPLGPVHRNRRLEHLLQGRGVQNLREIGNRSPGARGPALLGSGAAGLPPAVASRPSVASVRPVASLGRGVLPQCPAPDPGSPHVPAPPLHPSLLSFPLPFFTRHTGPLSGGPRPGEEAEPPDHVGKRGVEAPVRDGDPGVEVEASGARHAVFHHVVVGPVGQEVLRRAVEVGALHPQGLQDLLLDVDLVRLPADPLDRLADEDVGGVRVGEARARREVDPGVGHHCRELLPPGGLEGVPGFVPAPGPGGGPEARGVAQSVAEGDRLHRSEGVVDFLELRNPADEGVVQGHHPTVPELHEGHGREGLGDRRPVEDGAGVHLPVRVHVGEAVVQAAQNLSPAHEIDAPAHDPLGLQPAPEPRLELRPRLLDLGSVRGRLDPPKVVHSPSLPVGLSRQRPGDDDCASERRPHHPGTDPSSHRHIATRSSAKLRKERAGRPSTASTSPVTGSLHPSRTDR